MSIAEKAQRNANHAILRSMQPGIVVGFSLSLLLFAPRVTGLVAFVVFDITYLMNRKRKILIILWCIFFILSALPLDIRFRDVPGPPRIVSYIVGYPTQEAVEKAKRGDVVLGGCSAIGLQPKWVLVL